MSTPTTDRKNITYGKRYGISRQYSRGSRKIVAHAKFNSGIVETISARAGPFSSTFDVYAMILTKTPSFGPLEKNGSDISTHYTGDRRYSLFCPGDELTGAFLDNVVYDIIYLQPRWVDEVISAETDVRQIKLAPCARATPSPVFLALWRRIHRALGSGTRQDHVIAEECIRLLVVLLAEPQLFNIAGQTMRRRHVALAPAIRYIEANLGTDLNVAQIASSAGLSAFHFCRVFRHATGLSVRQFVRERRLEKASRLLAKSNMAICGIAHECGFSSQSHLTTAFRTRYGTTPNVFRNGERS